jgi:hypothetical protein
VVTAALAAFSANPEQPSNRPRSRLDQRGGGVSSLAQQRPSPILPELFQLLNREPDEENAMKPKHRQAFLAAMSEARTQTRMNNHEAAMSTESSWAGRPRAAVAMKACESTWR